MVAVPVWANQARANYYSFILEGSIDMKVRDWLIGKLFEFQSQAG